MATQQQGNGTTTLERLTQSSPEQFGNEVQRVWQAVQLINSTVIELVEGGELPQQTGAAIVSAVAGQAFAYPLFHGQPSPADLIYPMRSVQGLSR